MSDIQRLDLDALEPVKGEVKLNGQIYYIFPPTMDIIIQLNKVATDLNSIDLKDGDKLAEAVDKCKEILSLLCKDLKDVNMSLRQISGLMTFVFSMITPPGQSELIKNGITPADEKKNTDSVNQSLIS